MIERGPTESWFALIANRTPRAYLLQTEPSLLSFHVELAGAKEALKCALPKEQVPKASSTKKQVELKSGEALIFRFDVHSLCFRENNESVLVPGARVRAHFGWPTLTKTRWKKGKKEDYTPPQKAPFVAQAAEPARAAEGSAPDDTSQVKELVSAELALSQDYATPLANEAQSSGPIELSLRRGADTALPANVIVQIGLKNRSGEPQRLFFRRELLTFDIDGPIGSVRCDPAPDDRAPDRKAFLTLGAGELMTVPSRLIELCPMGAFSEPGLYRVSARLDAKESGESFGLDAFTGQLETAAFTLVRIRGGKTDPTQRMTKVTLDAALSAPAE